MLIACPPPPIYFKLCKHHCPCTSTRSLRWNDCSTIHLVTTQSKVSLKKKKSNQKFTTTTNMATVQETLIMYLLGLRPNWRQWCRRRWSVRPLNPWQHVDGEFLSLVISMWDTEGGCRFQYFQMSAGVFNSLLCWMAPHIKHETSHSAPVSETEPLAVSLCFFVVCF